MFSHILKREMYAIRIKETEVMNLRESNEGLEREREGRK